MSLLRIKQVFGAVPFMPAPFAGSIRILAFSANGDYVSVIRTDLEQCRAPFVLISDELEEAILSGEVVPVDSSFSQLIVSEDELTERAQAYYDSAKKLMIHLLGSQRILGIESAPQEDEGLHANQTDHNGGNRNADNKNSQIDWDEHFLRLLFDKHYANTAFRDAARRVGVSKKKVTRYYYRYLAYGMTPFALAGKQKPKFRPPTRQKPGTKRRGRKPSIEGKKSTASLPTSADVRPQLEKFCEMFLKGDKSFTAAYHLALRFKFAKQPIPQERLEEVRKGKDLTWEEIADFLLPPEERPTRGVFRDVIEQIKQERGIERMKSPSELRPRKVEEEHRGRARDGVRGPLFMVQIDSTKLQERNISRLYPFHVISPSTLYLLVDVWSTFIIDFVRSLDHPSFNLGAATIRRCLEDRAERYLPLGIPYDPSRYAPPLAPSKVIADRFEFPGPAAKVLREFGIKFGFARPGKGKDKGPVEGTIGQVKHGNAKQRFIVPGEYPKMPGRGDDDGMSDATLDTRERDERLYRAIDAYNDELVPIEDYPPDALEAGLKNLTRRELFLWGLKNRPGGGLPVSDEDRITFFMQAGRATVTRDGIELGVETFDCPEFNRGLFLKRSRTNKIDARFDNEIGHFIYIRDGATQRWLMAFNKDSEVRQLKYSMLELEAYRKEHSIKTDRLTMVTEFNESIKAEPLNRQAKAKHKAARAYRRDRPKSDFQGNIRNVTAQDLALEHAEHASREIDKYTKAHDIPDSTPATSVTSADDLSEIASRKPVKSESISELALRQWREQHGNNCGS